MAGYITRFEFAERGPFPTELVPIELAMAKAHEPGVKLLAFWFTSGYRDLVAVWDAASEHVVHAIVAEVTRLCGISAQTVCVFTDEELAQGVLIPDRSTLTGDDLRNGALDTYDRRDRTPSP